MYYLILKEFAASCVSTLAILVQTSVPFSHVNSTNDQIKTNRDIKQNK